MQPSPRLVSRLVAILLMPLCGSALAYDGLTVGVNAHPAEIPLLDVHAVLPMFTVGGLQHSARADVTYALRGLPGIGVSYVVGAAPEDGVERYLGAGAGATFVRAPLRSPRLSAHALAGMRVPLHGGVHAVAEVAVAGNGLDAGIGLALGLEHDFGASR